MRPKQSNATNYRVLCTVPPPNAVISLGTFKTAFHGEKRDIAVMHGEIALFTGVFA